jgi:manganese efflux pump family protein
MMTIEVLILGLALAMDAAVAAFALGILSTQNSLKQKLGGCFYLGGLFGFFQTLMVWIGSKGGYLFTFSSYGHLFQLLVAGIFFVIGAKILLDSYEAEEQKLSWGLVPTLLLALATSLDALAAGVSLATMPESYVIAAQVGLITFSLTVLFYFFSQIAKLIPI